MRPRARQYTVTLTSSELVNWFLDEVLGVIASYERYADAGDALKYYFETFKPYQQFGDFQMKMMLPRPAPLEIFVEPYTLYGHFRAWLRKRGIDPDTVPVLPTA